ncbi:SCO family protein [Leptospira sp. GIMC2001]|uniref:SCO family protein n=1 Tax=Leptospira sp. GIMC2001 TaxID=1513297 RepID=UPI00234AA521|nr:SCO family protein [Leptospira sp. GIMC2001]WCL50444.1 SCO family protein [Leptospira sp. GIMC2001]
MKLKIIGVIVGIISISLFSIVDVSSIFGAREVNIDLENHWIDQSGNTLDLRSSDHWTLIYSGFVGCGSTCPVAIQKMYSLSPIFKRENIQLVFLSTDPLLSPSELQDYLDSQTNENYKMTGYIDKFGDPANSLRKLKLFLYQGMNSHHSGDFILTSPNGSEAYILNDINEGKILPIVQNSQKLSKLL